MIHMTQISKTRWMIHPLMGFILFSIGCTSPLDRSVTVLSKSPLLPEATRERENAPAHSARGITALQRGDRDEATQGVVKDLNPEQAMSRNNRGKALYADGDMSGAMVQLLSAIRLNPQYASARSNLALVLFERGDLRLAVEQWQEALKLDKTLAGAWAGLGLGFMAFGDIERAVITYSRAVVLNDRYKDVHYLEDSLQWQADIVAQAKTLFRLVEDSRTRPNPKVRI